MVVPYLKRDCFIYYLSDNDNIFYVGLTINPKEREIDHKLKYGKNINFNIIEHYNDRNLAHFMELYWINQFVAWGFKLKNSHGIPSKTQYRAYKSRCHIKSKPFNSQNKN